MASLAKVRAETLDAIVTSLRAREPGTRGELGPSRCWPWRPIHSRVKRDISGWKVVTGIDAERN